MNDQMVKDLLSRVLALERGQIRYRQGLVTDDSPFSVALGGSDVAYEDVAILAGAPAHTGDKVAALTFGHDMLVLGEVNADRRVPHARVHNSTNLSIATASNVVLTFNSERWDADAMHSTSLNTGRLTAVRPGLHLLDAGVEFAASAGGNERQIAFRLNGTTFIKASKVPRPTAALGSTIGVSTHYRLAAGDYVEVLAYQDSGAALNVVASANYSPEFSMTWVSP